MFEWKWYHQWVFGICEFIDTVVTIISFGTCKTGFCFKYSIWLTEKGMENGK
jgi:hypothetical protein